MQNLPDNVDKNAVDIYPATPLQSGMIAATLKDSSAYVMQTQWELPFDFSLERLQNAMNQITRAHSILRTRFVSTSAGLYHVLDDKLQTKLNTAAYTEDYVKSDLERGFTLEDSTWMRITVLEGSVPDRLVLTIHHTLYDGWSLPLLIHDLFAAYKGATIVSSPPFKRVVEYVCSHKQDETEQFWKKYLAGYERNAPFGASINTEQPMKPIEILSCGDVSVLTKAASAGKVTMASLVKAAWILTLRQYLQTDDVLFGNVVSGRDIPVSDADKYFFY